MASPSSPVSPVKVVTRRPFSSNASSSSSSPDAVTAIWDFGSSKLPHDFDIKLLKPYISRALKQHKADFFLQKVVAVGPATGETYAKINSLPTEFETAFYPAPAQMVRGDDPNRAKYAMVKMYTEACRTQNILAISSDGNLVDAIARMIEQGIHVMAAVEDRTNLQPGFLQVPKATWIWRSANPETDTIVKNGAGLLPKY